MKNAQRPNNEARILPRSRVWRIPSALRTLTALTLGVWLSLPVALAQDASPEDLESVNRRIEQTRAKSRALEAEAQRLAQEVNDLRQKLITAARSTQQREALISSLEDQLDALEHDLAQRREELFKRHSQLSGTLGALARLSKDPPQAVFLYPGSPTEAVRGAVLLRAAVPALEGRARLLRQDLEALAAVREDINGKIRQLDQADTALAEDRAHLKTLLAKKRGLYKETAAESSRTKRELDKLVSESRTLRELVDRLKQTEAESERAMNAAREKPETPEAGSGERQQTASTVATRPEGLRSFPRKGPITAPARGALVQRYGADTGFGHTAKGITIATRGNAQIVAPFDGKVMFSGPFRDLGLVLIIEHDGGYHSVLSGFERLDAIAGQWVLAGEPVGIMPDDPSGDADRDSAGDEGRPRLYVEMRRSGQPVNPLRWITAGSLKVHG